jgi:hypothetical protein
MHVLLLEFLLVRISLAHVLHPSKVAIYFRKKTTRENEGKEVLEECGEIILSCNWLETRRLGRSIVFATRLRIHALRSHFKKTSQPTKNAT